MVMSWTRKEVRKMEQAAKTQDRLNIAHGIYKLAFDSIVQDPVVTDRDKYSVVLENERVRVLRYHDKPGDRTLQHAHSDYVLYAESSFKRRLTFPDGRKQEVDVKAGSVGWMKGHIHIGENIGDTNTDVILVELKEDRTLDKTEKDLK
jgi:hypothetical protein